MSLSLRRWFVDIIVGLAVLLADRVVKCLALSCLIPNVPMNVGSLLGIDLYWTLTYNQGAAWGAFEGEPWVLLFFRIVFVVLVCGVYVWSSMPPLFRTALMLILAGACGNIIDMFIWGHVVDMIHLQFWGWDYPVFNVADMSICIGAAAIVVLTVSSRDKKPLP